MVLDTRTEKRLRKDIERLGKKRQRLVDRLARLESKMDRGKLAVTRFQAKKTMLVRQMRGLEAAARTRQGKLGKAVAARK